MERARLAIEGLERLFVLGVADVERVARKAIKVEDVRGVAQLEGDVIGRVDDVVDAALAHGFEAGDEPGGAGADLDAFDDARGEPWAGCAGVALEREGLAHWTGDGIGLAV